MRYDPNRHHRRSIRLKQYDYSSAGAYFITSVAQDRLCLFGEIVNAQMILNDAGHMVVSEWEALPARFPTFGLDAYMVMPNHFHAIVLLNAPDEPTPHRGEMPVGAPPVGALSTAEVAAASAQRAGTGPAPTLGDVVGWFKSLTTHRYVRGVKESNWTPFAKRLWQRNYYEHIIRGADNHATIWEYITYNPATWLSDELHFWQPPDPHTL
jgi:REP element-mobilizing transposase RayT